MFYLTPLSLEGINALFSAKLIGICIYTTLNESLNIGQSETGPYYANDGV